MSWTSRLARATSFRLAAAQALVFVLLFTVAGVGAVVAIAHANTAALEAELRGQADRLKDVADRTGPAALVSSVKVLQRDTDAWELRLSDGEGRLLAGDLPDDRWPLGLATRTLVEGDRSGEPPETIRAYTTMISPNLRLTVGRDLAGRRADNAKAGAILLGVLLLALMIGLGLAATVSRRILRRIDDMGAVMTAYAAGDREVRMPVQTLRRSDLDDLAQALNRMLDQTTALNASLRRVSAAVAHDLRGPLARHNQEIARVLARDGDETALRAALETASERVDEVLAIFQAMLQLAELEVGAPGVPRERLDLAALARRVVEAYGPGAQDGGRSLDIEGAPEAWVVAEDRLLGRMISNLVENALTHTPPGTRIAVQVCAEGPRLVVRDDGCGVPAFARRAIFEPFHRLDAARATPGSGLGLAMVAATASAFGARVWADDAEPGLRVTIDFDVVGSTGRSARSSL